MAKTLDVLIKGGTVVDGTGKPGVQASIGIADGRIVAIGSIDMAARQTIDASGKVVAPGFIDIHTHYDVQAFWDPTLSPSSNHGVTTVVGGNCGFSIAPLNGNQADADYLMRMLARVEGMPLESLREGASWDWKSFGEYLQRLEGTLSINAGFLVGHSALRRYVMGARAVGEKATAEDIEKMQALLRQSIQEGGAGFSSTISDSHNDGEGNPVPSRHASDEELLALASVVKEFPGTVLEFLPNVRLPFDQSQTQRLTALSLAAQRPVNWNVLVPDAANPERYQSQIVASDYAAERGAKVVALVFAQGVTLRINLASGFIFDTFPGWADLFKLPLGPRMQALRDPGTRAKLDEGFNSPQMVVRVPIAQWTFAQTFSKASEAYEGKTVGEVAERLGKKPLDTLFDVSLADDLKTVFLLPTMGDDPDTWKIRASLWKDERTVIGASDAGAHLDMIDTFAFSSQVLSVGVRERKVFSLEEAVRQLTDVPACLYGLRERGRIQEGYWADVVVFDPSTIGQGPVYARYDLPARGMRMYCDAIGIDHVFVNGQEVIRHGKNTGARAGRIIRSGRDTRTVTIPAASR
jgi:N-acyl-D-aspartate/D-glutamate deacylase